MTKEELLALLDEKEAAITETTSELEKAKEELEKAPKAEAKKEPTGLIEAEGGWYRAVRPCTYKMAMYGEGARLKTSKGQMIPRHFTPEKVFKEALEQKELDEAE